MFEALKNIFRRSKLRKYAKGQPTGLVPLTAISSVTVVLDREDPDLSAAGSHMEFFCCRNSLRSNFIILDTVKRGKDMPELPQLPQLQHYTLISRRRINWYGLPKMKSLSEAILGDTDLLINLSYSTEFPSAFISAVSPAKMKIGAVAYDGNPFDVVFADSESRRTEDKADAILKFLGQII